MIPNNIILTYHSKVRVPSYVFKNVQNANPDKNILFFDDEDIKKFLLQEYDSSYVDFFNSIPLGCIKADFFRYCYLFKRGGYYCDIDIQHTASISDYIEENLEFFSVNSAIGPPPMTFQALLYSVSDHPILKNCIEDIMRPEKAEHDYYHACEDMYKNIQKYIGIGNNIIRSGTYKLNNGNNVQIAQELCLNGKYVCVFDNKVVALSRYDNYKREEGFNDDTK